jgi:L-iditol 2-dehydrogenase
MAVKAVGAGAVAVVGAPQDADRRLPLARELGADEIIVAGEQDPVKAVAELTGGRGADLIVEASGAPPAISASVGMVRRLGRITAIGLTGQDEIAFPWDAAAWKVCTITFNLSTYYTSWDRAMGLIATKKLNVAKIVSHVEPLAEWERVFEEVENGQALKAILIP